MKRLFLEEQRMDQWWLKLILLLPPVIFAIALIQQPPASTSSYIGIGIAVIIMSGIYLIFFKAKLVTEITESQIIIHYRPFFRNKTVSWNQVTSAEIVRYPFAGYGIRWVGGKYQTIYNTKGRYGLFIVIGYGRRRFVIGTQKKDELAAVARRCMSLHQ